MRSLIPVGGDSQRVRDGAVAPDVRPARSARARVSGRLVGGASVGGPARARVAALHLARHGCRLGDCFREELPPTRFARSTWPGGQESGTSETRVGCAPSKMKRTPAPCSCALVLSCHTQHITPSGGGAAHRQPWAAWRKWTRRPRPPRHPAARPAHPRNAGARPPPLPRPPRAARPAEVRHRPEAGQGRVRRRLQSDGQEK